MAYEYTQKRLGEAKKRRPQSSDPTVWSNLFSTQVSRPVLQAGLEGREGVDAAEMANILTTRGPGTDKDIRGRQADEALFAGTQEAFRLSDENERRNAQGLDFLTQEFERAHGQPTLTDEHMRMIMGQGYDEAGGVYRDRMANLRDALGFTSGVQVEALARDTEAMRLGQMDTVRTNAVLEKAKADAIDRNNRFAASSPVYAAITRGADAERLNWLSQLVGVRLAQQGFEQQAELGREQATAAKQSALLGAGTSIAGAGIGAFAG